MEQRLTTEEVAEVGGRGRRQTGRGRGGEAGRWAACTPEAVLLLTMQPLIVRSPLRLDSPPPDCARPTRTAAGRGAPMPSLRSSRNLATRLACFNMLANE